MDRRGHLWIEQRQLVDQVVQKLRNAIVGGQFKPGERIRQEELAQQMGISRTPLRMALTVLTNQGLLHRTRSRGLEVPRFSYQQALDLYQMREMILSFACRLAAERISDRQLEQLADILADSEKFVATNDWPGWLKANEDFTGLVGAATGVTLLRHFLDAICTHAQMFRSTLLALPVAPLSPVAHAADEHRQIYRAIRDRDPDRAARAARDHVRQAQARYQAACRQAGQGGDGGVQLAGTG
jgi:GntR family transcriptional regulator of vanillate catabolism